jgi:pimeloyl-ACP methyl ester carboxylesterase
MSARATLVFVHGPCLGPWAWTERMVPHFEALGLRCFAPDLHEAWPDGAWTGRVARLPLSRYVDRLHALLPSLPGPRILIGHSMGASIVAALVARGAHDGAVLIAPTPPEGLEVSARGLLAQHPAAFARALIARRPLLCLGEPGRPDLDRVRALLLHPGASRRLVESVASRLRDEPFTACLDWLRPPPPPPPRGLRVPVLAIGGREDALVSVAALRRTAVAWNATAHVVPHAGHCPMLGAGWVAVARHVERWLFDA